MLSQILGINVPTNRAMFMARKKTKAIVIVVMERLPEGKMLNREELEQLLKEGKIRPHLVEITLT